MDIKRPTLYEAAWLSALASTLEGERKRARLSRMALAAKVGISDQTVMRYERQTREMTVPNLMALIEALDMTVEDFISIARARAEVEYRALLRSDELAARRGKAGLSVPPRNLQAVADSNVGADEEVEGHQEEP
ncbi:helix-turn-helix domain-containing protein [Dermacoccus sp. UBA1591]|uniref:helix-turn-helix domain-containing protein n=1 Tax=Dermacoccus sp. UBA1591 TaxID=1946405 RepID=UPI00257950CD|nr:helix-turn-helix transcriptional regulator [Dermacoccus sp. UBA1591]